MSPYANPEAKREHDRRYYAENREKIIEKVNAWTLANPERTQARMKAWRLNNSERQAEHGRRWYLKNREVVLARVRARDARLREETPDAVRAAQRDQAARRRVRLRMAHVEKIDYWRVWDRDGGVCGICKQPADPDDWHLDHIVPVAKGGEHSYANVQVAHPLCNRQKAAR